MLLYNRKFGVNLNFVTIFNMQGKISLALYLRVQIKSQHKHALVADETFI